jgi:hypothetical protein
MRALKHGADRHGKLAFAALAFVETGAPRQVRAGLSALIVKTDRKDARGMAHLLRMGWFRPVHVKTMDGRE